eukprot:scaffold5255_cov110-Isochrysis_galbana.AAC.1
MRGVEPSARFASTLAPHRSRAAAHSNRPLSHAAYRAVRPSLAGWSTDTPRSERSSSTHLVLPSRAAIQRGEKPPEHVDVLTAAPDMSSARATSVAPHRQAAYSGVAPSAPCGWSITARFDRPDPSLASDRRSRRVAASLPSRAAAKRRAARPSPASISERSDGYFA